MSWLSLGTVAPIEQKWLDYQPTTQAPDNPTASLAYRITGLNVQTFDPDKFYCLVRFKHGDIYTRSFVHIPNTEPEIVTVSIPPAITTFPFSWVPQVQLVFKESRERQRVTPWVVRIDEFVEPATSLDWSNISRFLY